MLYNSSDRKRGFGGTNAHAMMRQVGLPLLRIKGYMEIVVGIVGLVSLLTSRVRRGGSSCASGVGCLVGL